jgi:cysteinyl-tRNA synthetase
MALKVYNTKTHTIEEFIPSHGNRVYMFVCGPTVYDHSHIGHARTYLAYDIIARYLRVKGYSVFYLMNITDIDDKIINKAKELGQDPLMLADRFRTYFLQDMHSLGIDSVNLYAKASEHIPEMIAQISTLIDKQFAYLVDGDVFFDVSKFPNYGKLSRQDINQLVMHRIDPDPRKKNTVDFALWKSQKPGEPAWDSPWGKGRPGWHIEDTAITATYFGPSYDLHGGGLDLIFPHHEAEIAQAEAATGVEPLVKYWIHSGLLTVSGTRMGKSMGNFITIKDALLKHDAEALRLCFAASHYRSQLEYDENHVAQAEQVLERLRTVYNQFSSLSTISKLVTSLESDAARRIVSQARTDFDGAMDDDFNTPRALAAMIGFAKNIEPYANDKLSQEVIFEVLNLFCYFGNVFGILRSKGTAIESAFEHLLGMVLSIREEARRKGNWETSDMIRNSLRDLGVIVEDSADGVRWHLKPVSVRSA